MKTKTSPLAGSQGFSLVELLVVIAVIAIIAAIAIPNIANITSQADYAKNQRNAQNIASVASAARAAGYSTDWGTADAVVTALADGNGTGIPYTSPNGKTMNFGVSGINPADVTEIAKFLEVVPGPAGSPNVLLYKQSTNAAEEE